MSDSKHERDDRAEAVQALMLIREQCADVNAWQVWAANGDLVEAYPNELLDHITALTQRAEAAEAERDALRAVYKAAAVYCGDRTVANAHALIDAVGEIRALAVQPTTSTGDRQ